MAALRLVGSRLGEYWRLISGILSYPLLAIIWGEQALQTGRNLLPRFDPVLSKALGTPWAPRACPECDFSGFWPAGRLAWAGHASAIYDPARFEEVRQAVFFPMIGYWKCLYPPTFLLAVTPFSFLPFGPGFYVWTVCLTLTAIRMLRLARVRWPVVLAAVLSPAALWNFELGQFGLLTGAALVAALAVAPRAPWLGGFLVGLLTIKPPAGILVPFALVAAKNVRAFIAATAAVLLAAAATTVLFGVGIWRSYFTNGLSVSRTVLDVAPGQTDYERFGVSVFWMVRSFGGAVAMAGGAQLAAAGFAVAAGWMIWRLGATNGRLRDMDRVALTVCLTLLATPYGYVDDMVAFSITLASLAMRRRWRIDLLDVLFWTWPTLCPLVYGRTGLVLTPVVVGAAALRVWAGAGAFARREAVREAAASALQMTV